MPEYFSKTTESGDLEFAVPDYDVTSKEYESPPRHKLTTDLELRLAY